MSVVSIRDLRNDGGSVVERAARGEVMTITKSGQPVAEIRGLRRPGLSAEALLERWKSAPALNLDSLRRDVDAVLDPSV